MGKPTGLRGSVQADWVLGRDDSEDHPTAGHLAEGR
jgi:hypothetical protein